MILPRDTKKLDAKHLDQICSNVCFQVKIKYPNFEMFLMDPSTRKSKRYQSLERTVFNYINS